MDIDKILQKFGVFSGLSGDALTACLPYCQDAMAELTAKNRSAGPAAEPMSGRNERQQSAPHRGGGPGEPPYAGRCQGAV